MREHAHITRRAFLRDGSLVGLAAAAPLIVPRHVLGSAAAPGASEQVVLGIVGMGQRGNQLLGNIPASGRVAAICDADSRRTVAATSSQRARWKVYQDYRKLAAASVGSSKRGLRRR